MSIDYLEKQIHLLVKEGKSVDEIKQKLHIDDEQFHLFYTNRQLGQTISALRRKK